MRYIDLSLTNDSYFWIFRICVHVDLNSVRYKVKIKYLLSSLFVYCSMFLFLILFATLPFILLTLSFQNKSIFPEHRYKSTAFQLFVMLSNDFVLK